MTGPSVAERPPAVDRDLGDRSAPTTETRRSSALPGIFSTWRSAVRYLSVWVGAGLLVYTTLVITWLIVAQ